MRVVLQLKLGSAAQGTRGRRIPFVGISFVGSPKYQHKCRRIVGMSR